MKGSSNGRRRALLLLNALLHRARQLSRQHDIQDRKQYGFKCVCGLGTRLFSVGTTRQHDARRRIE
eukprot:2732757-Prymnesium_polylepis.1